MIPSTYTFTESSSDWPLEFDREAAKLRSLFDDELIEVHHIGSTSVPGLAAKPTIDLLPVARDIWRIDEYTKRLEDAGYKVWGEYGLVGRRFVTKDRGDVRTHNIHIYQHGNAEIERHVAFCAYLRHHAKARDEYVALKREVFALHPADIMAYNDGKDPWIKRVEQLAIDWFRGAKS